MIPRYLSGLSMGVKYVMWLPSPLPFQPSIRVDVASTPRLTPSSEPSAPAVSSQERIIGSVGPPAGEGSAASEGWRCHPRLLKVNFKKGRIRR